MNRQQRRFMKREMERESTEWPAHLIQVPPEQWPKGKHDPKRLEVWRSRAFLVQVFKEPDHVIRMSVNRTTLNWGGSWNEDIGWEELQRLKAEIGHGDSYAIEVYPRERDVVNVANMRHLWILPAPLPIGWVSG